MIIDILTMIISTLIGVFIFDGIIISSVFIGVFLIVLGIVSFVRAIIKAMRREL